MTVRKAWLADMKAAGLLAFTGGRGFTPGDLADEEGIPGSTARSRIIAALRGGRIEFVGRFRRPNRIGTVTVVPVYRVVKRAKN